MQQEQQVMFLDSLYKFLDTKQSYFPNLRSTMALGVYNLHHVKPKTLVVAFEIVQ